jgi:hypothetical protein
MAGGLRIYRNAMSQMTKFKIEMSAHRSRIRRWAAHFERPMLSEWLKPKPNQQDNASIFL